MLKLLDFYKNILPLAGLINNGGVLQASGEELLIGGKPTVLPMAKFLKGGTNNQLFHPLAEDITMGASLVLKTFQIYANAWLNVSTCNTILHCVSEAIVEVGEQSNSGVAVLGKLPELSTVDVATICRVVTAAQKDNKLVDLRVIANSKRYSTITFPILDDIKTINKNNAKLVLYGVKHTRKAWKALYDTLITMCIPQIQETEKCKGAPLMYSMLTVITGYYEALSMWMNMVPTELEMVKTARKVATYMPMFEKKEGIILINQLPPQPGNSGSAKRVVAEPAPSTATPTIPKAVTTPTVTMPTVSPTTATVAPTAVAPIAAPATAPAAVAPITPPRQPGHVIGTPPSGNWTSSADTVDAPPWGPTPLQTPVMAPTVAPLQTPVMAPTVAPLQTPAMAPTVAPLQTPAMAPTVAPWPAQQATWGAPAQTNVWGNSGVN